MFVAEFGSAHDMNRALEGSPWMIGKYAVILQPYDGSLKPSDICFDWMDIWMRILNLPLDWMNDKRGTRAMQLLGKVVRMDVDRDGKASGLFLRARVSIEIDKPLRRGVMLKPGKLAKPEWFDIQYEKLPLFCFSCGMMGHIELDCATPTPRNEAGKLPYDIKLRAPEEKRRRIQSFAQAAALSQGSGSSSRASNSKPSGKKGSGHSRRETQGGDPVDDEEVVSPLKKDDGRLAENSAAAKPPPEIAKQLFRSERQPEEQQARKRKSKGAEGSDQSQTPDLNLSAVNPLAMVVVPKGKPGSSLVQGVEHEGSDEASKKQRMTTPLDA